MKVNSQQSTVNSQQSTVNSQQSTVNSQQSNNLNNFQDYVNFDLKSQAYDKLHSLITKFKSNYSQYTNKNYNETETRRDFLYTFFEAFGWDVSNKAGKSQSYRDVIHEDKVKVGKETTHKADLIMPFVFGEIGFSL